jgi:hypothetical protein
MSTKATDRYASARLRWMPSESCKPLTLSPPLPHSRKHGKQEQIFEEQKHCDTEVDGAACIERIYWHYGYRVALCDVLRQLEKLDKPN